jgi:cytidylate kinase
VRKVITIDGLAGSGKSSIARILAQRLSFIYFSSGLLYRVVAEATLREGVSESDHAQILKVLDRLKITLLQHPKGELAFKVDGKLINPQSFITPEISERTSQVAAIGEIRSKLVDLQREALPNCNLVAEGRDMGSVIFKDAQLKFFIEVDQEVRAKRRVLQLNLSEKNAAFKEALIKKEISERDERDTKRSVSPTIKTNDAITIDNSSKDLTEVVENMYLIAKEKGLV